jgi:hypothetical protein
MRNKNMRGLFILSLCFLTNIITAQKHGLGLFTGKVGGDGTPPNYVLSIQYAYHMSDKITLKVGYLPYRSERRLSSVLPTSIKLEVLNLSSKNTSKDPVISQSNSNIFTIGGEFVINRFKQSELSLTPSILYHNSSSSLYSGWRQESVNGVQVIYLNISDIRKNSNLGAGLELQYKYNISNTASVMTKVFLYTESFAGAQIGTEFRL